MTGSRSPIHFVPYDEAYEAGFEDMPRRVPDISKLAQLIGYEPKSTSTTSFRALLRTCASSKRCPGRLKPTSAASGRRIINASMHLRVLAAAVLFTVLAAPAGAQQASSFNSTAAR